MRGYQRRVIYLKNIGSSVFEEAYFVMKTDVDNKSDKKEEQNFINEANRIIEESVGLNKKRRGAIGFKEVMIFIAGFLISSIIFAVFL